MYLYFKGPPEAQPPPPPGGPDAQGRCGSCKLQRVQAVASGHAQTQHECGRAGWNAAKVT